MQWTKSEISEWRSYFQVYNPKRGSLSFLYKFQEEVIIKNEGADYHFPDDYTASSSLTDKWLEANGYMAYQEHTYDVATLSKAKAETLKLSSCSIDR